MLYVAIQCYQEWRQALRVETVQKDFDIYLAKECHSEVGSQQSFSSVHDLCHFTVCTMQRVVQVGQFLCSKSFKNN